MELKTISASKMNLYDNCPYSFMLKYKLGLMQLDTKALRIGSLWHKGLEMFHDSNDSDLVLETIKNKVLIDKTPEELDVWGEIRLLLEFYFNNPYTKNSIALEEKFSVNLDGLPPLVGVLDRRMEDEVLDYKTTSVDYTDDGVIENNQTMMYALAGKILTGSIPLVTYYVLNKKKVKRPGYKPQIISVQLTESDLEAFESKIRGFHDNVLNDRFDAVAGKYCFWCPFKKQCKK